MQSLSIQACERIANISAMQRAQTYTTTPTPLPSSSLNAPFGHIAQARAVHSMMHDMPPRSNIYASSEDKLLPGFIDKLGGKIAPWDVALAFAIESWPWSFPAEPLLSPWGVHNIWPYQENWRQAILPNCQGLDLLERLKAKESSSS